MMKRFEIYEGNMPTLEHKLKRIQNKCIKYGCDFKFNVIGETFKKVKLDDGTHPTLKFIIVEAEGKAIINGWKFVASLDHTKNGNIVNSVSDVEVPTRYYDADCVCEHCGTHRNRNNTYIVQNIESGDFKQIGKSCLMDYTGGLNAEMTTLIMSGLHNLEESQEFSGSSSSYAHSYFNVKTLLTYAVALCRKYGYSKDDTAYKTLSIYKYREFGIKPHTPQEFDNLLELIESIESKFTESECEAQTIIDWISSQDNDTNYFHNLKVALSDKMCSFTHLNLVVSAIVAHNRELERKAIITKESKSTHQGEIGDKLNVLVETCECVTSWETQWGWTFIYKFIDKIGNIYTWKTSKGFETDKVRELVGVVKSHNQYRGINQTELTRCRLFI